jgi:2'-5' RNA ligase
MPPCRSCQRGYRGLKGAPILRDRAGRRGGVQWGAISVATPPARALGRLWRLARLLRRRSRLRASEAEAHDESVLIVPVTAGSAVTAARDWYASAQADGIPAHVTLLSPFLRVDEVDEAVERELAAILSRQPAFRFRLACVGRFPGAVYLKPEPGEPFVRLTEAIVARWPHRPAYGGAFDEVVPHVTLTDGQEPPGLLDELARHLPIEVVAAEAWLMAPDRSGSWSVRWRFPLPRR